MTPLYFASNSTGYVGAARDMRQNWLVFYFKCQTPSRARTLRESVPFVRTLRKKEKKKKGKTATPTSAMARIIKPMNVSETMCSSQCSRFNIKNRTRYDEKIRCLKEIVAFLDRLMIEGFFIRKNFKFQTNGSRVEIEFVSRGYKYPPWSKVDSRETTPCGIDICVAFDRGWVDVLSPTSRQLENRFDFFKISRAWKRSPFQSRTSAFEREQGSTGSRRILMASIKGRPLARVKNTSIFWLQKIYVFI